MNPLNIILYIATFILGIGSIVAFFVFLEIGKTAKAAGVIPASLIRGGQVISTGILLMLNFLVISALLDRDETSSRFATVNREVNNLKDHDVAIRKDHEALKPLVANAAVLSDMSNHVKSAEANASKALAQSAEQSMKNASYESRIAHLERNGSQPTIRGDQPPTIQLAPPAPVPAPQSTVNFEQVLQKMDANNKAEYLKALAALQQQPRDNTSAAAIAALNDSVRQAQQTAEEAKRLALQASNDRASDRDVNASRLSAFEKKLDASIEETRKLQTLWTTVPGTTSSQTAYVQLPSTHTATSAPLPTPAPPQANQNNTEMSIWVTNTLSTAVWRKVPLVSIPWWRDTTAVTYVVKAVAKTGDSPEAVRMAATETIRKFHHSDAPSVIRATRKDAKEGHDELVKGFAEAKAEVLKGNTGLSHLRLHPYYTLGNAAPAIPQEML